MSDIEQAAPVVARPPGFRAAGQDVSPEERRRMKNPSLERPST